MRAVEKATDMTPTGIEKPLAGTNARSSKMKQEWAAKSKTAPERVGNQYKTYLNNDAPYASYVNDGHRMGRHFVPGLYINPGSGMLEYSPGSDVGIVVGTKTSYVPGIFMVEAAKEEYSRVLKMELSDLEAMFR